MTENSKTISLLIATGAILLLALATRPRPPAASDESLIGKPLFANLDDTSKVMKAKRMKMVSFDDRSGRGQEFEVVQSGGAWTLPTYKNYPVDAAKQMAAAAAALVDLKVLDKVGHDDVREHELYGVVEPKPGEDQLGKPGIGKLVVIDDGDGTKPIARLIIGKQDKPARADELGGPSTELRFVRIPGQDRVYRVALKADKFSTKFEDWVETDLLKLHPWEVTQVKLRDYSVPEVVSATGQYNPKVERHSDLDLTFDDKSSKWELKQLLEYKGDKPREIKLAGDEELSLTPLNDLKNALGSLKIVDVARKPETLSASLKVEKQAINSQILLDLVRRGFPFLFSGDQGELGANDGEVIISMKDGVEYKLLFGAELAALEDAPAEEKTSTEADRANGKAKKGNDDAESSNEKKTDKVATKRRFVMVMARFNPDLIPKPELEPDPDAKASPEKPAESTASGADKKGESKASDAKNSAKSTDAKAADKKGTAAAVDAKSAAKKDDAKSTEAKSADVKAGDKATEEDPDVREAERAQVEKENRRKQDEYNDKLKQGQQHVKELNARFADWYYVVSDQTYRKIHLGKDEIIKKKTPEKPADAALPANPFTPKSLPAKAGGK